MTDYTNLVIQGDAEKNDLRVKVEQGENGDLSIYNIVQAGAGNDQLSGRAELEDEVLRKYGAQLFGEDGNDQISDSLGDDTLSGGAGNDAIYSGYGHDIIDGGEGTDTLYTSYGMRLSSEVQTIIGMEHLSVSGTVKVGDFDMSVFEEISDDGGATITFTHAQTGDLHFKAGGEWRIVGSRFDDHLDISGQRGHFTLSGAAGNDTIIGGDGSNLIHGQTGDDILVGGDGRDILFGDAGNDNLSGGAGNDSLNDTEGDSVADGGSGNDTFSLRGVGVKNMNGGEGNDRFYLSSGHNLASGGSGNDVFYGSDKTSGADWVLDGGKGQDSLVAEGDLSDLQASGMEKLVLYGIKGGLTIDADVLDSFGGIVLDGIGAGGSTLKFSGGGDFTWKHAKHDAPLDRLIGSKEVDRIDLSASVNYWTVNGGNGDDVITGGSVNDAIHGDNGNDTIIGGDGNDRLWGGVGKDTFVFSHVHNAASDYQESTIMDFNGRGKNHDVIDLSDTSIKDFSDLIDNHVWNFGRSFEIYFGRTEVSVNHTNLERLDSSHFIF